MIGCRARAARGVGYEREKARRKAGVDWLTSMIALRFSTSTSPIMYASLTEYRWDQHKHARDRRKWRRTTKIARTAVLLSATEDTLLSTTLSTHLKTRVQNLPLSTLRWTAAPLVFGCPKWNVWSTSSTSRYPSCIAACRRDTMDDRAGDDDLT